MNMLKNLFAALIIVGSLAMIACQGDTKDARDKASETPASTTDAMTATPAGASGDPAQQAAAAAAAESQVPTGPTTTVVYEHTDFDFGTVKEGEKVKHTFKFKNTGSEPLIISNAKGSCGCTVPKWPSEPVAPGATSQIDVEFDSKGKPGKQTKRVTVNANTVPAQMFLNITGNVEKDPNAPATPSATTATPVPPKH
jgi:Protein of unknown function (DUF1573)